MSLARDILEVGLKKPDRRAEAFANAIISKAKPNIALYPEKLENLRLGFFFNLVGLAKDIKNAMCFSIDHLMYYGLRKMEKTPEETLLKALKYARPPHDPAWIEYTAQNGNRVGWLVKNHPEGGLIVQGASRKPEFGCAMSGRAIIIDENGFRYQGIANLTKEIASDQKVPNAHEDYIHLGRSVVSLLLLLNSRSNIVKVAEPLENYDRLNKKRVKNGDFELPALKQIKFDIARIVDKNPDMDQSDAEKEMAATLVRGHFKVRKTGAWFWGPYVRSARNEEEKAEVHARGLGEMRAVTATGQHCLPS